MHLDALKQPVGGIRGSSELRRLVTAGDAAAGGSADSSQGAAWAVAFCMFPVCVDQVMRVADAEQLMPPKVRPLPRQAPGGGGAPGGCTWSKKYNRPCEAVFPGRTQIGDVIYKSYVYKSFGG